jgi:hypothetical protein
MGTIVKMAANRARKTVNLAFVPTPWAWLSVFVTLFECNSVAIQNQANAFWRTSV